MRIKSPVSFNEVSQVVFVTVLVLGLFGLIYIAGVKLGNAHNPYGEQAEISLFKGGMEAHADTLKALDK